MISCFRLRVAAITKVTYLIQYLTHPVLLVARITTQFERICRSRCPFQSKGWNKKGLWLGTQGRTRPVRSANVNISANAIPQSSIPPRALEKAEYSTIRGSKYFNLWNCCGQYCKVSLRLPNVVNFGYHVTTSTTRIFWKRNEVNGWHVWRFFEESSSHIAEDGEAARTLLFFVVT